ncbi:hypothetical protein L1987_05129 [Smallanthus sonchifolius]|uniref:Uncharacterized protein n=1 Tax=Smallanthus sonchifolius TaxID=185202 RepID=A0ACB9JUI2_9ASTR|nr:hypothetical protein L1987_05129 [Smallanthus sonchifolius]
MICIGRCNLRYLGILDGNSDLLAKRRRNRGIIPLDSILEGENQLIPSSGISIEIPRNVILRRNSILAYFDDPRYIRKRLGLTKYETRELRMNSSFLVVVMLKSIFTRTEKEKSLPQHEAVVYPKPTIPYVTDIIHESLKVFTSFGGSAGIIKASVVEENVPMILLVLTLLNILKILNINDCSE